MSPSQTPVVKPPDVWAAYIEGRGRPSIQIVCGGRSTVPVIFHATTAPEIGSLSATILKLCGPMTRYWLVYRMHCRSGIVWIEICQASARARASSLIGRPR